MEAELRDKPGAVMNVKMTVRLERLGLLIFTWRLLQRLAGNGDPSLEVLLILSYFVIYPMFMFACAVLVSWLDGPGGGVPRPRP